MQSSWSIPTGPHSITAWKLLKHWSWLCPCVVLILVLSEIPSGICVKLRTVAASNNRVHMPWSLYYCLFVPHIWMVLLFTHIPFVVNHTINATPPERLQQCILVLFVVTIIYRCWCQMNMWLCWNIVALSVQFNVILPERAFLIWIKHSITTVLLKPAIVHWKITQKSLWPACTVCGARVNIFYSLYSEVIVIALKSMLYFQNLLFPQSCSELILTREWNQQCTWPIKTSSAWNAVFWHCSTWSFFFACLLILSCG